MLPSRKSGIAAQKYRIMIVEDHPVFRMGLCELINHEDDMIVCGQADDAGKAFEEIEKVKPDMIIVDISLKGRDGIDLVREVKRYYKDLPTLVLSMHDESRFAERSLAAGARGYIMKRETSTSIVEAVRCVLSGRIYLSEKLKGELLDRFAAGEQAAAGNALKKLTAREFQVFRMLGRGLSTGEIAKHLNLSIKTIGTYRERIKEKLNFKHAGELIHNAMLWVETEQTDMKEDE